MANKGSILMERYELGRLLGQGTFAKVYYARSIRNGQSVAIKVIDKEKVLRVGLVNQIKREISVMRLVRHPNIVHLYEVMATKTKIYFVMEYAKGGELFNKVAKGKLKEDVARKYFQQLINAVDFCHSRGVYHRDLKPENLLLDDDENLKISDFGLSAFVESKRQDGLLHTMCGTPAYVAPEVINRKGYDGAKADIWSCGVVLFVLLAGYLPFQDSNLMEIYRKIGKAEFRCPSWFPPEARRLLSKMLDPNPSTRISLAKIRGSTWFRRGISTSSKSTIVDYVSTDLASANTEEKQEVARIPNLNAFDIISLYAKFDLSKLFEEPILKKEAKFTSWKPASVIISKLEDTAKRLKLKVSKRDAGLLRFEGTKEGRKGILAINAEIFEVIEAFHLVEVKKSDGDTLEYQEILNEGLRPGLQDIVWTWQEEKQPQQSEDQLDEQPNDQLQQQQQQQLQPQQHLIQQEQLP
ncbi:PREDICTED: CBL-interacting serine/threonine-protein kinase 10-like [Nicotiana attenuata]|uniref:non-specific serine/threonine protein kinase n=1 Tax=Nicotiana attenuata TaxID=49451 RepID=A0A314KM54_NICAT|nr:PREDICTED: CBL-interacting serine/threonine-protein kinase 10-like [Nicotiana attenuata]OIT30383.1 cbl-interacting protein kinase 18 [Nicotiana attenuata]